MRRGLGIDGYKTAANFVQALKTGGGGSTTMVPTSPRAAAAAPTAPPAAPPKAPMVTGTPSKPPVVPILIGVGVVLIGGLAYYFLAGKKTVEPGPGVTPTPVVAANTPVPEPTPAATPAPTPQPTRVAVAPTPAPTTAPSLSRHDRFLQALEVARKVDASMPVDQLNAYLKLAEDFPEEDQGVSRLDSVIAVMVDEAKSPEAKLRRFQQTQNQLERAGNLGSESALMFIANQMLGTDPALALGYFRRAAEKGNSDAMVKVGNLLFRGAPGLPARPEDSARWFRAASEKGNPLAKLALAECYHEGKGGVPRDLAQSTKLLNEAYSLAPTDPAILANLGLAYERGEGVPVDTSRAVEYMTRATDLGSPVAMGNLGTYFMKGYVSGRSEPAKAAQLFKRGADLGNGMSMFFYAQCLISGQGVAKNEIEARNFYRAAAERGIPPAIQWCQQNRVPFTPQ